MLSRLQSFIRAIAVISTISFATATSVPADSPQLPDKLFDQPSIRIVVTDSGLGGVSVAADVTEKLKEARNFESAEVIFFNSQAHATSGYNHYDTTQEKAAVFDRALQAIEGLQPDVILIACNTLSTIYDETEHSRTGPTPAIGIIDCGVDLIEQALKRHPDACVILFATPTTVERSKHYDELRKRGVPESHIWQQPCNGLAGRIERDPDGEETGQLIQQYVDEIIEQLDDRTKTLLVSYNCTHYGYVNSRFQQTMLDRKLAVAEYLDPNPLLSDVLFRPSDRHRFEHCEVTVRVISQPLLSEAKQEAIGKLIEETSPQTAEAIQNYSWTPKAFLWRDLIESEKATP